MTQKLSSIIKILESEQLTPSDNVANMCEKIMQRHGGRVQALLYYGSSLRAMNDPSKMLDFYVLVDNYFKTHKNPIRAALNYFIPPAVYYLENKNSDGTLSTCKYSIISLRAFEAKTTKKAFLSMIWGRFSQPCVLLFPNNEAIKTRILKARANSILHLAAVTRPLVTTPVSSTHFWARGFRASYTTELRPEKSASRSQEIVTRYSERYETLMHILYGSPDQQGRYALPNITPMSIFLCNWQWAWRRILGKPLTAIRVLNSAFTFNGGIDYVLHKLKSHSGVTIQISSAQRRHPILWSPVLAWKLYRRGAFR